MRKIKSNLWSFFILLISAPYYRGHFSCPFDNMQASALPAPASAGAGVEATATEVKEMEEEETIADEEKEEAKEKEKEEDEEYEPEAEYAYEDLEDYRNQVMERFNSCCPFDVRLHRVVDPDKDDWESRCLARAIGMRWNKVSPTIFCEWPVGSGQVYPQGELGYEFLKIYAEVTGTGNGEVKRPNSWRELKGCLEHIEPDEDEDEDKAADEDDEEDASSKVKHKQKRMCTNDQA